MSNTREFFSTAELAEIVHVSRVTVFRWIKEGSLKAHKSGRNYVISVVDIGKMCELPLRPTFCVLTEREIMHYHPLKSIIAKDKDEPLAEEEEARLMGFATVICEMY